MAQLRCYPLRDFQGQRIPGEAHSIFLPEDATPEDYKRGVLVFGEMFWLAEEVASLPPERKAWILRQPHRLLYGHRNMMLSVPHDGEALTLKQLVRAVDRAIAA